MSSIKALDGLRGVRVNPHAPFSSELIQKDGDQHSQSDCQTISSLQTNQGFFMQRVWHQRPGCMRPVHYCLNGDQSTAETIANVMTSLPFVVLGLQAPRKNLNCKLYANSLIGVGVASTLYHTSRGRLRKYLRWVDYSMIAGSTVCLSRAIRNDNPKLLMAASALCLPFQPLLVSSVHTAMMEVAFAKRAVQNPQLKTAHNLHKLSLLLSGALFVADDVYPKTPFVHAAWHLTAAVGVATCNKLLQ